MNQQQIDSFISLRNSYAALVADDNNFLVNGSKRFVDGILNFGKGTQSVNKKGAGALEFANKNFENTEQSKLVEGFRVADIFTEDAIKALALFSEKLAVPTTEANAAFDSFIKLYSSGAIGEAGPKTKARSLPENGAMAATLAKRIEYFRQNDDKFALFVLPSLQAEGNFLDNSKFIRDYVTLLCEIVKPATVGVDAYKRGGFSRFADKIALAMGKHGNLVEDILESYAAKYNAECGLDSGVDVSGRPLESADPKLLQHPEVLAAGADSELATAIKYIVNPKLLRESQPRFFTEEKLAKIPAEYAEARELLEELDDLIGMEGVKQALWNKICYCIEVKERQEMGLPNDKVPMNALIVGNPGTGKTTVSRKFGEIYRIFGMLEKGHTVLTSKEGLVEGFVGQTGAKTMKKINEAMDGILAVDEAYRLIENAGQGGAEFGKEAFNAIVSATGVKEMRERLAVLFMGYEEETLALLATNPGLDRRFPMILAIADYNNEQLQMIMNQAAARGGYWVSREAHDFINWRLDVERQLKGRSFGNAGTAENMYKAALERQNVANVQAGKTGLGDRVLLKAEHFVDDAFYKAAFEAKMTPADAAAEAIARNIAKGAEAAKGAEKDSPRLSQQEMMMQMAGMLQNNTSQMIEANSQNMLQMMMAMFAQMSGNLPQPVGQPVAPVVPAVAEDLIQNNAQKGQGFSAPSATQ